MTVRDSRQQEQRNDAEESLSSIPLYAFQNKIQRLEHGATSHSPQNLLHILEFRHKSIFISTLIVHHFS